MKRIVGHKQITNLLDGQIKQKKVSHGYLFLGPAHVGKFTTAKNFAKELLCLSKIKPDEETCLSCFSFEKFNHSDFKIVSSEENGSISIGSIREITRSISLYPQLSKRKVVIFEEASLMTLEAQNAFLKTLEEPPPYATFILVSQKENLLPTILSRATVVNFQPVLEKEIKKELIKRGKKDEDAILLSRLCLGQIGRVLEDDSLLKKWAKTLALIEKLADSAFLEKLNYLKEAEDTFSEDLFLWLSIFKDLFIYQKNPSLISHLPKEYKENIRKTASQFKKPQIIAIIKEIQKTQNLLTTSVNKKLLFENLMIKLKYG